jgi:DnaJ-class molecular chaperone
VSYVTCQECGGEGGWEDEDGKHNCPGCGGWGHVDDGEHGDQYGYVDDCEPS